MFEEKKLIVTVSKKAISLAEVAVSNSVTIRPVAGYPFTENSLVEVFSAIKKSASSPIRMVLSEEYAYVVSFIPQSINEDIPRNEIKDKAQERIPEDLNTTAWDYKEILIPDSQHQESSKKFIQVIAAAGSLYSKISYAIATSGLNVEAIEPMSFSLARLTENQTDPHLIIYIGESSLFIACWKGVVLATENISGVVKPTALPDFVQYVQDSYKIRLKTIILSGNVKKEDVTKFSYPGFTVGAQNLDPRVGMALKRDIHGDDERILNIVFQKTSSSQDDDSSPKKNKNVRNIAVMSLVGISSLFLFTAIFVKKRTPIQSTASSGSTSTTAVQKNQIQYSISILNGGLDPMSEVKVLSAFESRGFTIIRVGEADNKDYVDAIVNTKQPLDDETKNRLDNILKSYYSNLIVQSSVATAEADIILILGKNK